MIFDKASSIDHRTIGGEAFIITGGNAVIHSLNEVGSFIFDLCDGRTELSLIVDRVVETFDIDQTTADADVNEFVLAMEERGMLERRA